MDAYWSKEGSHFDHEENCQEEIRIIVIGKTGLGKSSLGNSICGSKNKDFPFKGKTSSSPVTHTSQCAYRDYNGRKLCVVDTPGFCATDQSNDTITNELKKGLQLVSPGPHAFLIVVNGRCTTEQIGVLALLRKILGEHVLKHCIIVITREDDLRNDDDDQLSDDELIDRYFHGAPEPLVVLITTCCTNHLFINEKHFKVNFCLRHVIVFHVING